MIQFDAEVQIGEIREWLKPRGYNGEYLRFIVISKEYSVPHGENIVKIQYSNGTLDDLFEADLLKCDEEDEQDWEYSARLEDITEHQKFINEKARLRIIDR